MRMTDAQFVEILVNVAVTLPSIPDSGEQEGIANFCKEKRVYSELTFSSQACRTLSFPRNKTVKY